MKIDKEYPATHSMDTSWFAIDADGNVAIIEFGDDGPVPDFVGQNDIYIPDVMFKAMAIDEHHGLPCLLLTDEQIDVMLSYSMPKEEMPYSYSVWYEVKGKKNVIEHVNVDLDENPKYSALLDYLKENEHLSFPIEIEPNCSYLRLKTLVASLLSKTDKATICRYCFTDGIIEIDAAYEQDVTSIMANHKDEFCLLSPKRHLYYTDCNLSDYPDIRRHVKRFYDFDVEGGKEMGFTPFFFYKQEWLSFPAVKQSSPTHPFTVKQLSKDIAEKAIKLPIRFEDAKYFQFVKYYGFETWGGNDCLHTTDDKYYFPMKDEKGGLHLYGTKHEFPIDLSEVKGMLERGEIKWEGITSDRFELEKSNGRIAYKSYKGDIVSPYVVWLGIEKRCNQIANAPLEE